MVKMLKTYRQSVPALRFIGLQYGDEDRVNGSFGAQWNDWFGNNRFDWLEKSCSVSAAYEDSDAYIGLMRWKDGEPFEYWIGIFCPAAEKVPEGFGFVDFPESDLGVVWLYGKENELYQKEAMCAESCGKEGMSIIPDEKGAYWFFERYGCPRFTTKDENGCVILDICHFVEKLTI